MRGKWIAALAMILGAGALAQQQLPQPQIADAGGWSYAAQDNAVALSVSQPAFVWIERVRQPDAPITSFLVEGSDGYRRDFDSGVLDTGSYRFLPNQRADGATLFRARSRGFVTLTSEGPSAVGVNQPFRIPAREGDTALQVSVPEAGLLQLQPLAGNVPANPDWLDSEGAAIASGAAIRVYGPDVLTLVMPPDGSETSALVRFVADHDMFEPNDVPELAAEVQAGQWYEVSTGPGDVDWFSVDLPEDTQLGLSVRGLAPGQAPQILLPDGSAPDNWPLAVPAGETVLGLGPNGAPAYEPFLVRFDAINTPDSLATGEPVRLFAGARPSTYTFSLEIAENARVDARVNGLPQGTALNWSLIEDEEPVPASDAHAFYAARGNYTVQVEVGATGMPAAFSFEFTATAAGEEPNGVPEQALDIELPATLVGDFGIAGDVDWYRLTVPDDGILRIRQPENSMHAERGLRLYVMREDDESAVPVSQNDPLLFDVTLGVSAGEHLMSLQSDRELGYPVTLELAMVDSEVGEADFTGGLGVSLVGFGVTQGDGNWMETLARDTGTAFISADETEDLGEALTLSLSDTEEQLDTGWGWRAWALILLVLGGIGGAVWWRFGRPYLARRKSPANDAPASSPRPMEDET